MKTAKQFMLPAMAIMLGGGVFAQTANETGVQKKEQQIHIKMIREENGKKTVLDTIIDAGNKEALKALNIEIPELPAIPVAPDQPPVEQGKHIVIHSGTNEIDSMVFAEMKDMKISAEDMKRIEHECKIIKTEMCDSVFKDKVIMIKKSDGSGVDGKEPTRIFIKGVIIKDVTADERKAQGNKLSGDNQLAAGRLNFYPNPGNGKFNLTFELKDKGTTTVTILNPEGKKVYEEKLNDFSGAYDKAIDISGSPGGIYFLNVQQGNKNLVKKLVIQ